MEPIGLTFKHKGLDKYGRNKQGELMLVHCCQKCGKISINRIAGDDKEQEILEVFERSSRNAVLSDSKLGQIYLLQEEDGVKVKRQLFGKTNC